MRTNFNSPYMYVYFEKKQFKTLVALSPIFVAETKIIFGYNFVPLKSLGLNMIPPVVFPKCNFKKENETLLFCDF